MQVKQPACQGISGIYLRTECVGVPVSACQSACDGCPVGCPFLVCSSECQVVACQLDACRGSATGTTSRPSIPSKSAALQVYTGRPLARAVAAISAS